MSGNPYKQTLLFQLIRILFVKQEGEREGNPFWDRSCAYCLSYVLDIANLQNDGAGNVSLLSVHGRACLMTGNNRETSRMFPHIFCPVHTAE